MPCKNAGPYLEECITSVQNQNWTNWELIVIDDASTDNSQEILKSFAAIDARISVHNNDGVGIVPALEKGFGLSNGEWIHRMDADDVMPENKLETLYHLVNGRIDVVVTGQVKYFADCEISEGYQGYEKWLNELTSHKEMSVNRYRECVVASPNWLVHRSCFEDNIKIGELRYPEDFDMTLKWFKYGYQIVKSPQVTHLWREHPKRTSRASENYQQAAFFKMKVKHWLDDIFQTNTKVNVIGNNQKSKLTAKYLKENGIEFNTIKFEGKSLKFDSSSNQQFILCNWPKHKETQAKIKEFITGQGLIFGENIWLF